MNDCDAEEVTFFADSGFITASSYLKGLHWGDEPTSLMPRDAFYLTKARRFYSGLNLEDQAIIDSFSDREIFEQLDLKARNKRFNVLTYAFMRKLGTVQLIPHDSGERKIDNVQPD